MGIGIMRPVDKAAAVKADFLLTPDGNLSGYNPNINRVAVADAIPRITRKNCGSGCCSVRVKEQERGCKHVLESSPSVEGQKYCYDQVRVYAPSGEYLGAYSKILPAT